MNKDLCIVLTVRMESERLPGKAMADVCGHPLTYWIIRRLQQIGQVVVATTTSRADTPLIDLACQCGVPSYQGETNDVVGRMESAYRACYPEAKYIMRGLGDCPFMAGELISRMTQVMGRSKAEAFQWALAPHCAPVYGAREFPYSRAGWARVHHHSETREHVDAFYHTHREQFYTILHAPPQPVYFRPYRLEVDWQEDLDLVREIARGVGMLAPLPDVIDFLDRHPEIANLNHGRIERTGLTCYSHEQQQAWTQAMFGRPVVDWQDKLWNPPSDHAAPVWCASGRCLVGYTQSGVIYTRAGKIRGEAYLECQCGAGLRWVRDTRQGINAVISASHAAA